MDSPQQQMRLTQHLAVLHNCLRCQLGADRGPKYLLQDVSKLLILSTETKVSSKVFSDDYEETCGIIAPQKEFTFSFT